MAKARHPAERRILCTNCGGLLVVAFEAKSVSCRHCNGRVICEALDIKDYVAVRRLRTANRLRLHKKAIVNASVWAEDIYVEGRLTGDVTSLGSIRIGRRARVLGNVRARTLTVEEGAILVGDVRVGPRHMPEWNATAAPGTGEAEGADQAGALGESDQQAAF